MDSEVNQSRYRIEPSWKVALAVVVAYMAVILTIAQSLGSDYTTIVDTAHNAYIGAVIPLAVGGVLLTLFLIWARWDWIWGDPGKLPMTKLLWIPPVLVVLGIVVRTTGVEWERLPTDLIIAIALAGILVGYSEEILFRGIVLRSLRTDGRSEAHAAIFTTIGFGLMHLLNIAGGAPVLGTFGQVVLAAISGFAFYLVRRGTGLIIYAMIGHGLWDMSTFLTINFSKDGPALGALVLLVLNVFFLIAAIIYVWHREKGIRWQTSGSEFDPDAPLIN
ncbi:MAG: lysostaphin resistance A-like protein [Solirubrobacterales bacterium]